MSVCLLGREQRKALAVRKSFRRICGRSVCCIHGIVHRSAVQREPGGCGGVGEESGTRSMLQLTRVGLWPGPFHLCGTAGGAAGTAGSWLCPEPQAGPMRGAR